MPDSAWTLAELARSLEAGQTKSAGLLEQALDRINDPDGEGARAFISVDAGAARARAVEIDRLRAEGRSPGPFAGIPISVKDLFDVEGQVTRAGSKVLDDSAPAAQDAACIRKLREAGFVFVGRTNMTEFAYSGIGLNPHYPTPRSPFERSENGRIPGGSSSGAAVSVADGMAAAGIGTDTGGSCRIPAAFCGVVGYKPTARRVDQAGTFPLSASLDSIGPLANSVACCASLDAVLAGEPDRTPLAPEAGTLRLGVLSNYVLDGMDKVVASAYQAALDSLAKSGVQLVDVTLPDLERLPTLNARGGIVAAEAYRHHADLLAERYDLYDPRVNVRLIKAREQDSGEYEDLLRIRAEMIEAAAKITEPFDALVMPTVPIVPPRFSEFDDDSEYGRLNLLTLRNPTIGNFLDRCAISIPMTPRGEAPAGLMLMGPAMGDAALFDCATIVEQIVRPQA